MSSIPLGYRPSLALLMNSILISLLMLSSVDGALRHIQVFFRHGERTPTSFLSFPTEHVPPKNTSLLELGELTQDGMWQEYRLGIALRTLYGPFLGDFYRSREINVYSGRDNRTVASALLMLAGLFPPKGSQQWNRALPWQPIPVETDGILDHPSFGMFDHCPVEKARVQQSEGYTQMERQFEQEMAELRARTGLDIPNLDVFQKVLDAIITRAELPKLLPLPGWARAAEYLVHIKQTRLSLHEGLIDLFLDGMGGWHLDQLAGRMDDVVNNRTTQKSVFYSAHDTNFLTFGRYLNISVIDDIFPSYGSLLAFELHQKDDQYFVELKFRMGLNGSLETLRIAECPGPCPLEKFKRLRARVTTLQWMARCEGFSSFLGGDDQCTLYGSIAGALMVLVVLLFGSMLSLLLSCRSYKRRYEQLAEDEKSPLLVRRPTIEDHLISD